MTRASVINRINYETNWLSRSDLVHVGYAAMRRLIEVKAEHGVIPNGIAQSIVCRIDDALRLIDVVHTVDELRDPHARARELDMLGDEIRSRNQEILFGGVSNQAFPINRQIGGRWFDELGWEPDVLEALREAPAPGV